MAFLCFLATAACLLLPKVLATDELSSTRFHKEVNCGVQVPLDPGQAYHVTRGLGRLGCAELCAQEEACLSYTTSDLDCLLYPVRLQTCGPSPSPPHASYYVKEWCLNGGTQSVKKCYCPVHAFGERCQEVMKDCRDWIKRNTTSGVYWVQPPTAPYPFQVFCQMTAYGGRTYVQQHRRDYHALSFNRTWEEYKAGFGDLTKNFWLGLRKLNWLTEFKPQNLNLQCDVVDLTGDTSYPQETYSHIRIGDESTDFELLDYEYKWGVARNCLVDLKGSKFVTFDHGDSSFLRSCAGELSAGWWLKPDGAKCTVKCNPNGRLKTRQETYRTRDVYFPDLNATFDVAAVYIFLD